MEPQVNHDEIAVVAGIVCERVLGEALAAPLPPIVSRTDGTAVGFVLETERGTVWVWVEGK